MALDTQAKRASAIGVSSPWRSIVPVPDGAIGQGDRQTIAYYCSAVLFGAAVDAVTDFSAGWFAPLNLADWTSPTELIDFTSSPLIADWTSS